MYRHGDLAAKRVAHRARRSDFFFHGSRSLRRWTTNGRRFDFKRGITQGLEIDWLLAHGSSANARDVGLDFNAEFGQEFTRHRRCGDKRCLRTCRRALDDGSAIIGISRQKTRQISRTRTWNGGLARRFVFKRRSICRIVDNERQRRTRCAAIRRNARKNRGAIDLTSLAA